MKYDRTHKKLCTSLMKWQINMLRMIRRGWLHHVIKTVPRVKDPMDHLNGKTIQKPIPQQQNF
jgi:hypothetical protein